MCRSDEIDGPPDLGMVLAKMLSLYLHGLLQEGKSSLTLRWFLAPYQVVALGNVALGFLELFERLWVLVRGRIRSTRGPTMHFWDCFVDGGSPMFLPGRRAHLIMIDVFGVYLEWRVIVGFAAWEQ